MGRYDTLLEPSKPPVSKPIIPAPNQELLPSEKEPTNTEAASIPTSVQTRKVANGQTSKPVSPQTGLHANPQTGKPANIQKYSTYLTLECKRRLKRLAFETERKDYEVLIEAVEQHLERQKSSK